MKKNFCFVAMVALALFLGQSVSAEEYFSVSGDITFEITVPTGGADLKFDGSFCGEEAAELTVNGTVFSIKESKDLLDENGMKNGEAVSSYGEAKTDWFGTAETVKIEYSGSVKNESDITCGNAGSSASQEIIFSQNNVSSVEGNAGANGYTSAWQSGQYAGAEVSGITWGSGCPAVQNTGQAQAGVNYSFDSNTMAVNTKADYDVGAGIPAIAKAEAGLWPTREPNRISVTIKGWGTSKTNYSPAGI